MRNTTERRVAEAQRMTIGALAAVIAVLQQIVP